MADGVLEMVRSKYGSVASSDLSGEHAGVREIAEAFGYSPDDLRSVPAAANLGLSCGNPVAKAHLRPGEVVVDLGSGGGMDVFLVAAQVGPEGRAVGIDMTPAMVERARRNALAGGYANVDFHLAEISHLPLADSSVDCVISNCVLNLAPDKPAVFREIARVLRPGGRLAVSDIALKCDLPEALRDSMAAYVGCIAGAIGVETYQQELLEAGFAAVEVVDTGADLNAYAAVEGQSGCCSPAAEMATQPAGASPFAVLDASSSCCAPPAAASSTLHEDLAELLREHDVNRYAASVRVFAIKGSAAGESGSEIDGQVR